MKISLPVLQDVRLTKHIKQAKSADNLTQLGLDYLTMRSDRIRNKRKEMKLTQQKLGDLVGVSKTTVSQWEKGDYSPNGENLSSLARVLGVSIQWILDGKGDDSFENVKPVSLGARQIPVLSYVQAGLLTELQEISQPDGELEYVQADEDLGEGAFAMRINGDSMQPDFSEGDLVIIDPDIEPVPGDFVAAKNGSDEATFKKYRPRGFNPSGAEYFELVPLNEDYAPIRSDMSDVTIIGVMVEHRKYRRRRK